MRLSALGDVAMTIPVLYPVCKANPGTRFIMLTKKWPASMFHDRPANLMVVGIDTKDYKGVFGLRRLASKLRKQYQIDAVEKMIVDEGALEFAFEGLRFYDLMRVALRRGDPAFLANKVYGRKGDDQRDIMRSLISVDLNNSNNWFLKWNGQIGF